MHTRQADFGAHQLVVPDQLHEEQEQLRSGCEGAAIGDQIVAEQIVVDETANGIVSVAVVDRSGAKQVVRLKQPLMLRDALKA